MVQRLVVKTPPLFCGCNCPIRSRVCSLVVRVEDTRSVYFLFIYLFIYLAVLGLGCGMWDLPCVMRDLSLQHTDSLAVVHGLQGVWAQ